MSSFIPCCSISVASAGSALVAVADFPDAALKTDLQPLGYGSDYVNPVQELFHSWSYQSWWLNQGAHCN